MNTGILIERDTTVLMNVKTGRGASASHVACPYHVLEVYEKHYNKWFMSKKCFKKWKGEEKKYKVKVRMMRKNAIDQYSDVELSGDVTYSRSDVCRVVGDDAILGVVGKMLDVVE